jgi:NADH-quinone oxidoreductase subunit C
MIPEELRSNPHVVLLGERAEGARLDRGELTLHTVPSKIVEACRLLKNAGFNRLSAVTAVDWHPQEPRFEVVYHLHKLPVKGGAHERLRLKCRLGGDSPEVDSVTGVWEGANWYEREVFDLFGISFSGHPDLRRMMMPDDWIGHPLRKDYPIHGHKYDYAEER